MIAQEVLSVSTRGRGTYEITAEVERRVRAAGVHTGLCHCFVQHTSASLILCENADPTVRRDLEAFLCRLVPDGDARFEHSDEGPDDMPAHLRAILTKTELTLPIGAGRLALGTWQGLYLYEHRTRAHRRQVVLTISGEAAG
ncbi:secondary thiamine-phosphate synthase enzyme YjbQ [Candidatus Thiodictyon syntrophicum]|jgi:secondary thiamine-phosphate synthase enzyme|uniref:Secondary thiamine-phosphate synthase n=1 Tax=Candidatus Thiodictyon syntrophicum TaxID=1166950 RepID=A0A2K8U5I5_9GAMM|nr:secondary thiamine-phosphate synthase enzyme YjbQ [Candidatus Thiodictyon syntrophicum]AUB80844.1 secondary thiamine-phosphate synthase [Candidatus Thiodictyon syntrophicum]